MSRYSDDYWPRYVPVAERRAKAARKVAKLKKAGRKISPIEISGRKIAKSFWGEGWCKHLESFSDFANRLPRGRTYVRNGSVIDLRIENGQIFALISGSEFYEVNISIKPLAKRRWATLKKRCVGQIGSLVELLRGSLAKGVMEIATDRKAGLFPSPLEISMSCSCPDWAGVCKHVAATLYGVGARLDHSPELLFRLRGVDPAEMVEAAAARPPAASRSRRTRVLATDDLTAVFGVDIDLGESTGAKKTAKKTAKKPVAKKTAKKPVAKKAAKKPVAKKPAAAKSANSRKVTRTRPPATSATPRKKGPSTASPRRTRKTPK